MYQFLLVFNIDNKDFCIDSTYLDMHCWLKKNSRLYKIYEYSSERTLFKNSPYSIFFLNLKVNINKHRYTIDLHSI